MTLPSRIAAVVLLLAALGLVFVLVSNAGVSTDVFLADPTLTPLPAANAENWSELMEGQLIYGGNPEAPYQVSYTSTTIDEFIQANNLQPLAADTETPLLDLMTQLRTALEDQVASLQLTAPADAFTGPATEDLGGVPVVYLRAIIPTQTRVTGEEFSGLDLFLGLIDQGGGQVMRVQYVGQGGPNAVAFQDFMAWLAENVERLAQPAPEPTPEATEEAEPVATEEAAPAATEEAIATEEATAEPEAAATEEPTEEAAPAATEEATAAPSATEEASAVSTLEPSERWVEITPGQVLYAANPESSAQISYSAFNMADFITQSQLETPAEDSESPALDLLNQMKTRLEEEITSMGLTVEDDAFTGPELEEFGGVETALVRMKINPQDIGGQPFPGVDMALAILDHGDGTITAVQYMLQDQPDDTIYGDVLAWLEDNAERLATAEPEPVATEAAPEE